MYYGQLENREYLGEGLIMECLFLLFIGRWDYQKGQGGGGCL